MRETEAIADARRFMEICNGCRYCEGFCAVFPAMELRREFANADLSYLANLCHSCRACFHACQYAPPHQFGVNVPQALAEVRAESYQDYAWPKPLAGLFQRNGLVVSLAAAADIALVLILATALQSAGVLFSAHPVQPGAFYAVIPFPVMMWTGLLTFGFALVALFMGARNFWRDAGGTGVGVRSLWEALRDILTLRYLGGGGDGCNTRDESFSMTRRWLHHAMFYGFMLCFAATAIGTIYHHFLDWQAPYPLLSWPVVLGTLGGIGLLIGTVGLFATKLVEDPAPQARQLLGMDVALLALLALAALTGLVLLILRATDGMGIALAVHLGVILALFLVLPYSKMVHGVYRSAALLRFAAERTGKPLGGE
jgi:citrate/tricarballylate utilization protein